MWEPARPPPHAPFRDGSRTKSIRQELRKAADVSSSVRPVPRGAGGGGPSREGGPRSPGTQDLPFPRLSSAPNTGDRHRSMKASPTLGNNEPRAPQSRPGTPALILHMAQIPHSFNTVSKSRTFEGFPPPGTAGAGLGPVSSTFLLLLMPPLHLAPSSPKPEQVPEPRPPRGAAKQANFPPLSQQKACSAGTWPITWNPAHKPAPRANLPGPQTLLQGAAEQVSPWAHRPEPQTRAGTCRGDRGCLPLPSPQPTPQPHSRCGRGKGNAHNSCKYISFFFFFSAMFLLW